MMNSKQAITDLAVYCRHAPPVAVMAVVRDSLCAQNTLDEVDDLLRIYIDAVFEVATTVAEVATVVESR